MRPVVADCEASSAAVFCWSKAGLLAAVNEETKRVNDVIYTPEVRGVPQKNTPVALYKNSSIHVDYASFSLENFSMLMKY